MDEAGQPTPDDRSARDIATSRESFIPLRHLELFQTLPLWLNMSDHETACFHQLYDRLAAIFHVEHLTSLLRMEELYGCWDPDREETSGISVREPDDPAEIGARQDLLFERIDRLLTSAHYFRLTRDQLQEAIRLGSDWGPKLVVDFDFFQRLEIYARGYRRVLKKRRRWQTFYREENVWVYEFRRLVMAFQVARDMEQSGLKCDRVYLKNFKNIPESELELLLPGTRVQLSLIDRGKILLPTMTGAALTGFKLFRAAAVLTLLTLAGLWNWVLLIGGLLLYISKSFFSYFRTREKYEFELTRSLYLKNLDNNAGVLYRIFNESEEQELCEALMGYAILAKMGSDGGMDETELDGEAERFLQEKSGQDVDFDVHDSLVKMQRLGLALPVSEGRWKAIGLDFAPRVLAENWRQLLDQRRAREQQGLPPDDDLLTST